MLELDDEKFVLPYKHDVVVCLWVEFGRCVDGCHRVPIGVEAALIRLYLIFGWRSGVRSVSEAGDGRWK